MQVGAVEFFAMIAVLIMALLALGYFVVLPVYALGKLSKTWKGQNKIILFTTYFVFLAFLSTFLFSVDWYLHAFHLDIRGSSLQHSMLFLACLLPLLYILIAWFINIRFHGHVVTVEGCNQPSGCKMEETEK